MRNFSSLLLPAPARGNTINMFNLVQTYHKFSTLVLLPRLNLSSIQVQFKELIQINNNISHIQLQNSHKHFTINAEFEPLINRYQWFQTNSNGHIFTYIGSNLIYLHQLIYGNYNTSIHVIDHINRNVLDNTLSNLRLATVSQNAINKSNFTNNPTGFMGIKPTNFNTYQVSIGVNNKNLNIGTFTDLSTAIKIRLQAEWDYFGEFSPNLDKFEEYGVEKYTVQDLLDKYSQYVNYAICDCDIKSIKKTMGIYDKVGFHHSDIIDIFSMRIVDSKSWAKLYNGCGKSAFIKHMEQLGLSWDDIEVEKWYSETRNPYVKLIQVKDTIDFQPLK